MPRPKTSAYYEARIATLMQEELTVAAMAERLGEEAAAWGRNDAPSRTVVGRLAQQINKTWRPVQLRAAALFRWPEAMEQGALPWEASRAALDLLRYRLDQDFERPSIHLVQWYWRVRLGYPDASIGEGNYLAAALLTNEMARRFRLVPPCGTSRPDPDGLERCLAYRTYHGGRTPENVEAQEAMERRTFAGGTQSVRSYPLGGPPELGFSVDHPLSGLFILELQGLAHMERTRAVLAQSVAALERELEEERALTPEERAMRHARLLETQVARAPTDTPS